MKRAALILFVLIGAIFVFAVACGSGADAPKLPPTDGPTLIVTPPPGPCVGTALEISVKGDAIAFDKNELSGVASGAEVALCFKNVSNSSQHNWVLLREGTKDAVAQRGIRAGADNDWVQPGDPDVIANTKLVGPREEGEVRFTVPEPGRYQFICTFPGHTAVMFGDLVVTP